MWLAVSLYLCPKLVNLSSSALHLHLSGLLEAGAGWWAARVIGTECSGLKENLYTNMVNLFAKETVLEKR